MNCVEGEGEIITKTFNGMDQSGISISMHADVFFSKSDNPRIEITTYENLFNELEIEEGSGKIDIDTKTCINSDETPVIEVFYSRLEALKLNGSADIRFKEMLVTKDFELKINGSGDVVLPIETKDLEIKINGSGDVAIEGYTKDAEISINGSGDINAKELQAQDAEVKINGSGNVRLTVSNHLEATISGSGDVTYYGNPEKLEIKSLGSGNVEKGSSSD